EDDQPPPAIGAVLRKLVDAGTVVVASAGNEGWCRPTWPAAFPHVIGVAALSCSTPAGFSNHGRWVDACAPGVDVHSTFVFHDGPATGDPDLDRYQGWATWSGTSFAAPKVA